MIMNVQDHIQEIKKQMYNLIPNDKLLSLIEGEDMLNLTSDIRKDFTRYVENRENPEALDGEEIAQEDRIEFDTLESELNDLLPDEDSVKNLLRYIQLVEIGIAYV